MTPSSGSYCVWVPLSSLLRQFSARADRGKIIPLQRQSLEILLFKVKEGNVVLSVAPKVSFTRSMDYTEEDEERAGLLCLEPVRKVIVSVLQNTLRHLQKGGRAPVAGIQKLRDKAASKCPSIQILVRVILKIASKHESLTYFVSAHPKSTIHWGRNQITAPESKKTNCRMNDTNTAVCFITEQRHILCSIMLQ